MNLHTILSESFRRARSSGFAADSKKHPHQQRSESWVRELAAGFRASYSAEADVRVLSRYDEMNKGEFSLQELLYDVCVCRVGSCSSATGRCSSATGRKQLCFVSNALWQVESEFGRDSQAAVYDFNKLVLGSAANKLFVGPAGCRREYLESLIPVARCCTGNTFTALVPHPDGWDGDRQLELLQFAGDTWKPIAC